MPIQFDPLPQDDPKQRRPDTSKAKRLLGWEPKVDLETGLKLSLDYFRTISTDFARDLTGTNTNGTEVKPKG